MKKDIKENLIEELLKDYQNPEDLIGPEGLLNELKKRLIEKAMDAELTTQLGYEKHHKGIAKEKKTAVMDEVLKR